LMVIDVPAIEDVTVDPTHPTTVYPDVTDLSVGAADSEFYVKFRIGALPGRVVQAQLLLNSATFTSATGSGASVFTAASSAWSETTLVWNARPGGTGTRLARVDGIAVNEPYVFDLPAGTVGSSAVYAFAVLPAPTDGDAAHFDSKEVSVARGPILRLTVDPSMPVMIDAGVDAGDAAMIDDAAMPSMDSGAMHLDSGGDATRGPGPQGGCACRTSHGPSEMPGLACLAWSVATVVGRARRRKRTLRPF